MEVLRLIGNTPLVELKRIRPRGAARIFVKLEYLNPTGSHKDRIALYMIRDALERGLVKPGGYVVEASSGNTGIAVAFVARLMGLKPVIVVPRETSIVKVELMKMLGAEVVFGDSDPSSPNSVKNLARRIAEERGGVYLDQHSNPANARAHYETTAREIWDALKGEVHAFVMGVGTGGTITGVGRFLREHRRDVLIVAVTPKGSALVGGSGIERIEGLSSKVVPELYDPSIVDRVIEVSLSDAVKMCVELARKEGILGGPSTGANVVAALRVAEELGEGRNVVTLAPDSIMRYVEILQELERVYA